MTYELVKQLKDSGFPQEGEWEYFIFPDGRLQDWDDGSADMVYVPSLSELIKECGLGFHILQYDTLGFRSDMNLRWTANSAMEIPGGECKGSTPEEAVAKLWLSLNSKQI
jgi:hypothetical protein